DTGFRRRLSVIPAGDGSRVRAALARAVESWQDAHPGLEVVEARAACEVRGPREPGVGAEGRFPPLVGGVPPLVDSGALPRELAAATLEKYTLLAQAAAEDQRRQGDVVRS